MAPLTRNSPSRARKPSAIIALLACLVVAASSLSANAEPIHLKLSYFAAEQTRTYQFGIKPFVDGVNADGKGLVVVDVYPDGALGKSVGEQPSLVLNGVADIAWVVPGQTPYRFPDNDLFEMPGLIHDVREGTLAYTHLVAAEVLRGHEAFYVIGAYTTDVTFIHGRKPIASLAALAGQRIRANNPIEAKALEHLGVAPTVLPVSQIGSAIGRGTIDGAALNPTPVFDFGVAAVAMHHYLLRNGVSPLLLLMSRKKFDALPDTVKEIIRKHSGKRAAAAWIDGFGGAEKQALEALKADPKRTVVEPSSADVATAERIFRSMIDDWAGASPYNRSLLEKLEAELANIREAARR